MASNDQSDNEDIFELELGEDDTNEEVGSDSESCPEKPPAPTPNNGKEKESCDGKNKNVAMVMNGNPNYRADYDETRTWSMERYMERERKLVLFYGENTPFCLIPSPQTVSTVKDLYVLDLADANRQFFRVVLGVQTCDCLNEVHPCNHVLFVMLRLAGLDPKNELVWKTYLNEDEVTYVIRCMRIKRDANVLRRSSNCTLCVKAMMWNDDLHRCVFCAIPVHLECWQAYTQQCLRFNMDVRCVMCEQVPLLHRQLISLTLPVALNDSRPWEMGVRSTDPSLREWGMRSLYVYVNENFKRGLSQQQMYIEYKRSAELFNMCGMDLDFGVFSTAVETFELLISMMESGTGLASEQLRTLEINNFIAQIILRCNDPTIRMANLALDVIRNSCLELTINGAMPALDDRQRRILDNHHVLSFYDSEHAPLRGPDRFSWFAGRLKLLKHLFADPDISHLFNAKAYEELTEGDKKEREPVAVPRDRLSHVARFLIFCRSEMINRETMMDVYDSVFSSFRTFADGFVMSVYDSHMREKFPAPQLRVPACGVQAVAASAPPALSTMSAVLEALPQAQEQPSDSRSRSPLKETPPLGAPGFSQNGDSSSSDASTLSDLSPPAERPLPPIPVLQRASRKNAAAAHTYVNVPNLNMNNSNNSQAASSSTPPPPIPARCPVANGNSYHGNVALPHSSNPPPLPPRNESYYLQKQHATQQTEASKSSKKGFFKSIGKKVASVVNGGGKKSDKSSASQSRDDYQQLNECFSGHPQREEWKPKYLNDASTARYKQTTGRDGGESSGRPNHGGAPRQIQQAAPSVQPFRGQGAGRGCQRGNVSLNQVSRPVDDSSMGSYGTTLSDAINLGTDQMGAMNFGATTGVDYEEGELSDGAYRKSKSESDLLAESDPNQEDDKIKRKPKIRSRSMVETSQSFSSDESENNDYEDTFTGGNRKRYAIAVSNELEVNTQNIQIDVNAAYGDYEVGSYEYRHQRKRRQQKQYRKPSRGFGYELAHHRSEGQKFVISKLAWMNEEINTVRDQSTIDPGLLYLECNGDDNTSGHWMKLEKVGEGGSASCFHCIDLQSSMHMVCKQMNATPEELEKDDRAKQRFVQEVQLLRALAHPNIVSLYGATKEGNSHNIFMEWCPIGSIANWTKHQKFTTEQIFHYSKQILDGLVWIHGNQIIHRDIKGANLLIGNDGLAVKICDFGSAGILKSDETVKGEFQNSLIGTVNFMSPEMARCHHYGRSTDIWGFGCVIIEMATRKAPWSDELGDAYKNAFSVIYFLGSLDTPPEVPDIPEIPEPLRSLCRSSLDLTPSNRPTAADLLKHAFFASMKSPLTSASLTTASFRERDRENFRRNKCEIARTNNKSHNDGMM